MNRQARAFLAALSLTGCAANQPRASAATYGAPTHLTCVPYARAVSGITLTGDAYTWWDEAAGLYPRSQSPARGAVLVFAPHGSMTVGHLAVVTAITTPRQILVTQSNWLPYRIEHDQPIVDVSAANNWTAVRVWYEPTNTIGTTTYPTYGFILPH